MLFRSLRGKIDAANSTELHRMRNALDDILSRIHELLEPAGMKSYLKIQDNEHLVGNVVIESTQPTKAGRLREALPYSDLEHVPQTQYVKQTQVVAGKVWSPSKHIRFANETTTVSPARQYNSPPMGPESTRYELEGKILRVPETPHSRRSAGYPKVVASDDIEDDLEDFDQNENLFMHDMEAAPIAFDQDENFCDDDDAEFLEDLVNIEEDRKSTQIGRAHV